MHLIVDSHCENQQLLEDETLLRDWMIRTAKQTGMTVFGEPQVVDFPWPGSAATALSGVCFLGESSIVVHTYPEYKSVFIDVFSCKKFEWALVAETIARDFEMENPSILVLDRGVSKKGIIPVRLRGDDGGKGASMKWVVWAIIIIAFLWFMGFAFLEGVKAITGG